MKEAGEKIFLGSAIVAAAASSLCCILPVLAIAFGLGAFGIASVFETLRPYLLIVVILALAFSYYLTYFRPEKCDEGQACATKPIGRINQIILWTATIAIIAFALFPYYTDYIVSALDRPQPPTTEINQADVVTENRIENTVIENKDETAVIESESQSRKTIVIAVEGMTCEGCASHLNIALKRIKGVISADANYIEKNVKVVYNPKLVAIERIKQGIRDAGYDPK